MSRTHSERKRRTDCWETNALVRGVREQEDEDEEDDELDDERDDEEDDEGEGYSD